MLFQLLDTIAVICWTTIRRYSNGKCFVASQKLFAWQQNCFVIQNEIYKMLENCRGSISVTVVPLTNLDSSAKIFSVKSPGNYFSIKVPDKIDLKSIPSI